MRLLLVPLLACAAATGELRPQASSAFRLDTTTTKSAVLAAERSLIDAARTRGALAVLDAAEPGAAILFPGQPILTTEEARAPFAERYAGASSYTWQPAHVVASTDGNIGCTVGWSRFVWARDTTHAVRGGAYQTCWRRGIDGVWRIAGHVRADTKSPSAPLIPDLPALKHEPHSATVSRPGDQRTETQNTDSAFARFAIDSGVGVAFAHFAAPDVVNLMAQTYGRDDLAALFKGYPGHWTLLWGPMRRFGAASGGLGFNVGHSITKRIDGVAEEYQGKFMTIWRQNEDGSWSYIFDLGATRAPQQGGLESGSRVSPDERTKFSLPDTSRMPATSREIVRVERQRSAAIARNDSATLRRIYASDFRGVTAAGTEVDRERLLAVFASDDGASTFTMDQMSVRLLPGIAISSERLTTLDAAGVPQNRTWLTHVYQRRDGRWQIVAAQGTLIRQ